MQYLVTGSIFKYPNFDVSYTFNDTCFGFGNIFKNTSTIDGGNFTDTIWTISNIDTANTYDYSRQFSNPGTYTIKLLMEQDSVCRDSFVQDIAINPLPLPDFGVKNTCFGDSTRFIDASSISFGSYTQIWDFSDGNTGSGDSVNVKYATGGQKLIKLKLVSDEGCEADTSKSIIITSPEIKSINVSAICNGLSQQISSNNNMGLDSFVSYTWVIDGVSVSSDSLFDYKAVNEGVNKIQLFVETKNGCTITHV